jgi:hypothetical protein
VASAPTREKQNIPAPELQQETGESVRVPLVNSQQQIMTEFNGAVSEEDKIVAITKIVLNFMKENGH